MTQKKKKSTPSDPIWMKYARWIIPVMAILVYIPAFNADFTFDDIPIVEENSLVKSTDWGKIWTSDYWAGKIDATDRSLYRPFTVSTYAIQYAISGTNPAPFHILNVLLHGLATLLLIQFIVLLTKDNWLSLISGLLFAIHPVHTEAVTGIVGRAEILAGIFIILSLYSYHKYRFQKGSHWLIITVLSTALAVTSKEHGFMIFPLLALQEFYYFYQARKMSDSKSLYLGMGGVLLVSILFFIIRSGIVGKSIPHELWQGVGAGDRIATALRVSTEYIWLHLFPITLVADYWNDLAPIKSLSSPSTLFAIVVLAALIGLIFLLKKKQSIIAWGIAFFFIALLPVSNLVFPAGFVKAERILYIPSMGLLVAIAGGLVLMYRQSWGKIPAYACLGLMVLFFIPKTWIRNHEWKDNFSLGEATLKVSPTNPRLNNMMGKAYSERGDAAKAMEHYKRSVDANPRHIPALVNYGLSLSKAGRNEEAVVILEKALSYQPTNMPLYVNLMSVYRNLNQLDKNVETAERALKQFPESAAINWNAANAYQLTGNMPRSNELRAKAVALDPSLANR